MARKRLVRKTGTLEGHAPSWPLGRSAEARLIEGALLAIAVLVPLAYSAWMTNYVKWSLLHLFTTTAFGLLVWQWLRRDHSSELMPRLLPPLGLFLSISLLSIVWAVNRHYGWQAFYQFLLFALLYLVVASVCRDQGGRFRLLKAMALVAVPVCLVGLVQYLDPTASGWLDAKGNFIATIGNTNYVGAYLLTVIPIAVALAMVQRSGAWRLTFAGAALLMLMSVILTNARGAWVGLFAGLLTLGVLIAPQVLAKVGQAARRRAIGMSLGLLAVGLVLGVGLNALYGHSLVERLGSMIDPRYPSNRFRLLVWQDALKMFTGHPLFGVGIGNYKIHYFAYSSFPYESLEVGKPVDHPHNEYLNLMVEQGALGLLTAAWFAFCLIRLILHVYRGAERVEDRMLQGGIVAVFVGILVNAFFFFPFHEPATATNLWLLLGLLEGMANPGQVPAWLGRLQDAVAGSTLRRGLAFAGTLALLVPFFVQQSLRPLLSEGQYREGAALVSAGQLAPGRADLEAAVRWEPGSLLARYQLAYVAFAQRQYDDAIQQGGQVLKASPSFLLAHGLIGTSHLLMNRLEEAKAAFQKALAINPRFTPALNNLGAIYVRERRFEEAGKLFEQVIAIFPERPHGYVNLGRLRWSEGKLEEARELYLKGLKADRRVPSAWYQLAALNVALGRTGEGTEALAEAIRLDRRVQEMARRDPAFEPLRGLEPFERLISAPPSPAATPTKNGEITTSRRSSQ